MRACVLVVIFKFPPFLRLKTFVLARLHARDVVCNACMYATKILTQSTIPGTHCSADAGDAMG